MKKLTSVTLHQSAEGQVMAYTYSEIDDATGATKSDRNMSSIVLLEKEENQEVLKNIKAVMDYAQKSIIARYGE